MGILEYNFQRGAMQRSEFWWATLLLILLIPWTLNAHPLFDAEPSKSIGLKKNQGSLGFMGSYMHSTKFFNSSGSREESSHSSYPGSSAEEYHDASLVIRTAYGITDNFGLWFDLPLVYRKEVQALHAGDWGLGDIHAGLRYIFFRSPKDAVEVGFDLQSRFPTGDTDVHFSDPIRGRSGELPLGTGNQDLSLGLVSRWHALPWLSLDLRGLYTFRFSALVEYLQAPTTLQISADGSQQALLPTGNLNIDWGDEVFGEGRLGFQILPNLSFLAGIQYMFRRTTYVQNFEIQPDNDVVPVTQQLSKAFQLSGVPTLLAHISKRIEVLVSTEIPIMGENSPTFPLVESLSGYRYRLEVSYAF